MIFPINKHASKFCDGVFWKYKYWFSIQHFTLNFSSQIYKIFFNIYYSCYLYLIFPCFFIEKIIALFIDLKSILLDQKWYVSCRNCLCSDRKCGIEWCLFHEISGCINAHLLLKVEMRVWRFSHISFLYLEHFSFLVCNLKKISVRRNIS